MNSWEVTLERENGINKTVIVDDCYYEDWKMDCEFGWIAFINFREHITEEMKNLSLNHFIYMIDALSDLNWRIYTPMNLFNLIQQILHENEQKKLKETF